MPASDIKAGAAYIELYTKNNAMVRGLSAAQKKLRAFGVGAMSIGGKIAGMAALVQAPLQIMLSGFAETGGRVPRQAVCFMARRCAPHIQL